MRLARLRAWGMLGEVGELLNAAQSKTNNQARWYAIEILGELHDPRTLEPLIQLLRAEDVLAVIRALRAFGSVVPPEPLLETCGYRDSESRDWCHFAREPGTEAGPVGLKVPEWQSLSQPTTSGTTHDFKTTPVAVPVGYESYLQQVVLVERLRIVQSLIGFTRIESPDDATAGYTPADEQINSAPLTRRLATWAPAVEVRGEDPKYCTLSSQT